MSGSLSCFSLFASSFSFIFLSKAVFVLDVVIVGGILKGLCATVLMLGSMGPCEICTRLDCDSDNSMDQI